MSAFAAHFREHVTPRLRNLAAAEAQCVLRGVETFHGAYDAIHRYARQRGALLLPDGILTELEDWIATTLLNAIDAAECAGGR